MSPGIAVFLVVLVSFSVWVSWKLAGICWWWRYQYESFGLKFVFLRKSMKLILLDDMKRNVEKELEELTKLKYSSDIVKKVNALEARKIHLMSHIKYIAKWKSEEDRIRDFAMRENKDEMKKMLK